MSRGAPKAPVTYDGAYDETKTYLPLRIVTFDGRVYLSVATTTGVDPNPTVDTPWLPIGGGGATIYAGTVAGGPPTDGSIFWWKTDGVC